MGCVLAWLGKSVGLNNGSFRKLGNEFSVRSTQHAVLSAGDRGADLQRPAVQDFHTVELLDNVLRALNMTLTTVIAGQVQPIRTRLATHFVAANLRRTTSNWVHVGSQFWYVRGQRPHPVLLMSTRRVGACVAPNRTG